MLRGEVYLAALDPTQGSEESGTRPVIIVSRDAINLSGSVMIVVPVTGRENKRKLYPSHLELKAGEGGLAKDSVALCEQIRAITAGRLVTRLGHLSNSKIASLNAVLKVTLDLP